nr:MAG TPA: hypothetical protein [Bacteriophage sp.]
MSILIYFFNFSIDYITIALYNQGTLKERAAETLKRWKI